MSTALFSLLARLSLSAAQPTGPAVPVDDSPSASTEAAPGPESAETAQTGAGDELAGTETEDVGEPRAESGGSEENPQRSPPSAANEDAGDPASVDSSAETDPSENDATTAASPAEAEGGELSLDDIFGTDETLEDVEVIESDDGAGSETSSTTSSKVAKSVSEDLDFSLRLVTSAYFDVAGVPERQFSRNENRLEFTLRYTPNEHIQLVGNVEPVFLGVAQAQVLDDLATRQLLTPFHVESDAAYVGIYDLLPKLDLKIGRQIVQWGTADKFNPTNNINPDDLEDRPLFTEPIANQMVVVDYAPLDDKLWFQAVYVPLFYPALLPPSAAAGLQDPQTPVPFARESDVAKIEELQELLDNTPALVPTVVGTVRMPERRFSDGQAAIKLGTSLGGVDASISYYNGRHDIPMPLRVDSTTKDPLDGPPDEAECCYRSDVVLNYPRMQVLGLDFATQLPFLGNLGLWGEGALFFPEAQDLFIEFPIPVDVTPDDPILDPVEELSGPSVENRPYIKATAGLDYTFGKHVYVQAQYLRGFIDEFGSEHIGNYLVGGTELVFFGRHLLFRAFGVVDFPTSSNDNGSYVIYPELAVVPPWGSVTFNVGSFVLIGEDDTKFGQPAAGSSIVFTKVTGAF